jgi:hypothetical protein
VVEGLQRSALSSIRCVRSEGTGEDPLEFAVAPPDQYTEVAPGEIRDNYTGLVWQQGQSASVVPPGDAAAYCSSLALGGNAWRIPTPEELSTLVDEARRGEAINLDVFPETAADVLDLTPYWALGVGSAVFGLWFSQGVVYDEETLESFGLTEGWVKCVR